MGLGNFLHGIAAQINPFDNGKSYGSYNPPKKKLQPGDPGYVAPIVAPKIQNPNQQIKTNSTPVNLFQSQANDLKLPSAAPTTNPLGTNNHSLTPLAPPKPGTIIQPSVIPKPASPTDVPNGYQQAPGITGTRANKNGETGVMTTNKVTGKPFFVPDAPKPQSNSFLSKVGRGFKTVGQTAVGSVANVPEVLNAGIRAGSGLVQGVTQLPHIATALTATGTKKLANTFSNPVTRSINRGAQDANTGTKNVTNVVQKPFNFINQKLDQGAKLYADHVPGASAGASVYKTTQIPINVLAGLLTLGGGTVAEGAGAAGEAGEAGNAGKLSFLTKLLNKNVTDNPNSIISKTSQAISNKSAPVVNALNNPFSATKTGVTKLVNTRSVPNPANDIVDAGEAGNAITDASNAVNPTQIHVQQPQPIEVGGAPGEPTSIPVTNNTPTGQPIIDVGGDKPGGVHVPTPDEVAAQRAADKFGAQAPSNPDHSIDGITKADTGNASPLFTKAQLQNEQAELDDALKNGEIDPATHKAATAELQSNSAIDDTPKGKKITVKQVDSIPVTQDVPTDVPNVAGEVKAVQTSDPNAVATQEAANAPTVAAPAALPKEVQDVLDNPKQFSKRTVAAARNQRKLARTMAKTQEDTQAAITRLTNAKPTGDARFVPSGEFRRGAQGNISETAHKTLEAAQGAHDTANLSVDDVLNQAREDVNNNGLHSPATVRNLKAMRDSGRFARTSPEFKAINEEYKSAISNHARALSMTDRAARTTATGDQLTNRFTSKLLSVADDSGKIKDSDIQQITEAENAFTSARDTAQAAGEQFKATGSDSDFKAWKAAQTQAETADRHAKLTEYLVSKRVLKGNKDIEASKAVAEAEKNAGVYSMDAIDSNMLSGTGTMVRNYVNTLFPRAENKLFGRTSALVARKLARVDALGGSSGKGARIGAKIGKDTFKQDMAARKEAGVGILRRTVTAGNTVGEKNIEATTYSKAFSHYKQMLKSEGYKGKELNRRAEFNVRSDPDGLVEQYRNDTLQANALSGLTTGNKKIENWLSDTIQKKLADSGVGAKGQQAGRLGAKAVTRVGLGFPTVIARSLAEGAKRATLGLPEALFAAGKYALKGNKEEFASELSKSIQHAGTGAALTTLGAALGRAGLISGAYPTDPAEQAKWNAEGRQENSINIGGNWYSIPGYLGGFALPLMLGATSATGNIKDEATLKNAYQTVLSASPVDNIQSTLEILTGNGTDAKTKNAVTSLVRAGTPAGSLVAEIAKMTDSTQNDTTKKDAIHNILDQIASGIPGLNNKVNTTAKTDEYGNVLHNPNPIATALGAQGTEQKQGTDSVNQEQDQANKTLQTLDQNGVLSNKTLMSLVDPKIAKEIASGQALSSDDVAKVQKAVTKGIDATDDSAWREQGDYGTDKAALQTKLDILNADPTTKPSEKAAYETQIKRDDVLQSNNIPYDQLKAYESTSLSDWRAMGDSTSDSYDPDTYNALYAIDQKLAAGSASYNKTDTSKQKFSVKSGSGSGSGSKGISTDFGKIDLGDYAPKVKAYDSLDAASGQIPVIQVVRPNIVHSISSSG